MKMSYVLHYKSKTCRMFKILIQELILIETCKISVFAAKILNINTLFFRRLHIMQELYLK